MGWVRRKYSKLTVRNLRAVDYLLKQTAITEPVGSLGRLFRLIPAACASRGLSNRVSNFINSFVSVFADYL